MARSEWQPVQRLNNFDRRHVRRQFTGQILFHAYLGNYRLAHLTPPMIRQFADDLRAGKLAPFPADKKPHERFRQKRSPEMVRKIVTTLGTMLADMQERGLVGMNAVHGFKKSRKRGKEQQAERRKRGKLKVGVDIPSREEIRDIIAHASDRWRPIYC